MKARLSPQRIGRWSAAHPWRALIVWFVFVAACVALGARTGTQSLSDGAVGESARGNAVMDQPGLWGPPREYAYLHSNGDLHRVELLAIPVTLVVLLLAFGSDDVLLLCQNDASEETRADAGRRWSWGAHSAAIAVSTSSRAARRAGPMLASTPAAPVARM